MKKEKTTTKTLSSSLKKFKNLFDPTKIKVPEYLADSENSELNQEDMISVEKHKRLQIYTSLDCLLSVITYFDFFSYDAFKIAKDSKIFAEALEKNIVTTECLLFPFLTSPLSIKEILSDYNLTVKTIGPRFEITSKKQEKKGINLFQFIPFFKTTKSKKSVQYSYNVNMIFEKAAQNALSRFKTPVITPEILFITIMEEKSSKVSKVIKKIINNETNWYLLRYNLMKRIYFDELAIKNDVKKNQHYFAYLLKTHLSQLQFDRLIENNLLSLGVSFFRNKLILELASFNIQDFLEREIYKSMKITSTRKYS